MVVTKQDLHQLIDEGPEQEHQAAAKYLQRLRDLANDRNDDRAARPIS